MGGGKWSLVSTNHIVSAALAITVACRPEMPAAKRYRTECVDNPPGVDFPARLRDSIQHPSSYSGSKDIRTNGIARRFPTYAGYAYRGQFFLVWFTDTSVGRGQLDTIVRLENIQNPDNLPFQVAQVRWSYSQLYDWYYYLSPRLLRNNKVWMSGMDLHANRIIFHVSDTVVRHQTDSELVALNVPCGLVRLQLPQR
jgi:hypothetical protein